MKKFILLMLTAMFSFVGLNAQTAIQTPKLLDNTYVGVNAGVSTPLSFDHTFPVNTIVGVKVGKNFNPVFGVNVEGTTWLGSNTTVNHSYDIPINRFDFASGDHNAFRAVNVGLNGTINWTNLFLGYNPDKVFEVSTETGIGWLHTFNANFSDSNDLSAKTGFIFAWNIGKAKAWQITAEPTIYWNLTRDNWENENDAKFNKNHAQLAVLAGIVYKFKTSNGTHNFKLYDVGELNDRINTLQAELAKKPKEIIKTVNNTKVVNNGKYVIFFAQNSADLSDDAKAILDNVNGQVSVEGFASPEGTRTYNKNLSQKRAQVVADYLTAKGVTVTSTKGSGVNGSTSNRVVIVENSDK